MRNSIDKKYQDLVTDILTNGVEKSDRTGTGTISVFGRIIEHDMDEGFPLLTTKKMSFKNIKTELVWFLSGNTNIKFLVDRNCNIWNGDAFKRWVNEFKDEINLTEGVNEGVFKIIKGVPATYIVKIDESSIITVDMSAIDYDLLMDDPTYNVLYDPLYTNFINLIKNDDSFSEKWGDLGPIYGKKWTDWGGVNQIRRLSNNLFKNPDSRRLLVSAWDVSDIDKAVLPPCHIGFQCWTRELSYEERYDLWFANNYETGMEKFYDNKPDFNDPYYIRTPKRELSLTWIQRSVDTGLGLGYNLASYGLLLLMLCDEVGMSPGKLKGFLGDTHIYLNQVDKIKEQLFRKPYELPEVLIEDGTYSTCDGNDIKLVNYKSHPPIKLPLSN